MKPYFNPKNKNPKNGPKIESHKLRQLNIAIYTMDLKLGGKWGEMI
jgi:hypothetical protein